MPILNFPTLSRAAPSSFEFGLMSNTQKFESPLNRSAQTLELPGARWFAALTYANLLDADLRLLTAFLAQLRGQGGRFYLGDFSRVNPKGVGTGAPVVSGASQTGSSLVTTGWTPSITGILKIGDYVGFNGELRMLIADANSSAGGVATLVLDSPMRASPPNAGVITINKTTCKMMLTEDTAKWNISPGIIGDISISCMEQF